MRKQLFQRTLVLAVCVAAVVSGCSSSSKGNSTNKSGGTITLGYITAETGASASSSGGSEKGAEAYIDAVNAAGGVNGKQIKLIVEDDASSVTGNLNASKAVVAKHVLGVIEDTPFDVGGYKVLQQAGIPVTGSCCNNPEWGTKPNTNMFGYGGDINPAQSIYSYTQFGQFFKQLGVTNAAFLAYANIPASDVGSDAVAASFKAAGIKIGYTNKNVPFGNAPMNTYAIAMKRAGVNFAICSCVQANSVAMLVAAKQAGIHLVASLSAAGADSSIFTDPTATAAAQGTYWPTYIVPIDLNDPATNTFVANLTKYDSDYHGGYPPEGTTVAYLGAALMVKGLEMAGSGATSASVISKLLTLTNWTANGLLPTAADYNHFGTFGPKSCTYFEKVEGKKFVTVNNGKPVCGTLLSSS